MPGSRGWAQHTTKRTQAAEQWLWLLCARDIQTCQAAIRNPTGGPLRNQGKSWVRGRWKQGWAGAWAGCQAPSPAVQGSLPSSCAGAQIH